MKKLWLTATLAAALTACSSIPTSTTAPTAATLKKPALDRIAATPSAAAAADFRQFLQLAAQMQPELQPAVAAYAANQPWRAMTSSTSADCSACTTACATRRP
jgi:hypothetical protein